MPAYTDLQEFICLRARASQSIEQDGDRKHDSKKSAVNWYVVDIQDSCVIQDSCPGTLASQSTFEWQKSIN